jgi:rubrerythrin
MTTLPHPALIVLLQKAYSAEKAAAFAYQGHAASVKDPAEKATIRQIELDEWNHRREVLYEMGIKEKEHEVYFLGKIKNKKLLPIFEKIFFWGASKSFNDVDLDKKYPVAESRAYCRKS